jgi:hypothetical protein
MVYRPDPIRAAWGGVHVRDERLADACSRFERSAAETAAAIEDTMGAGTDDFPRAYQRSESARTDLVLFAEATLMFADATTNALAEAIRITWGVDDGVQALGFGRLLRRLQGLNEGRKPDLSSMQDRLHSVYVAVNVPRHVLAVHPPGNLSSDEIRFDRSASASTMRIGAWDRPPGEEDEELTSLRASIMRDAMLSENDTLGELVVIWALDHTDELSVGTRNDLESYVRRYGCSVSPRHVTSTTRDLIRDVTELFGWPRDRVASPP